MDKYRLGILKCPWRHDSCVSLKCTLIRVCSDHNIIFLFCDSTLFVKTTMFTFVRDNNYGIV